MYLVAEKQYCLASRIVDTFIDPMYNDRVSNPFITDTITKQEIANSLQYTLPPPIIEQFASAYKNPTAETLAISLKKVASAVESSVSPELAELISGCTPHIADIAEDEAATSPLGNVAATLNMPCLISFLMLAENLGRIGFADKIKIVHDQQHTYQEGYERIFEIHKGIRHVLSPLPHSDIAYSGLKYVSTFEMCDSKSSPLVQTSDLLAGVIHHLFKHSHTDNALDEGDKELALAILPALLESKLQLTWMICSEQRMQQLGSNILEPSVGKQTPSSETGRKPLKSSTTVDAPMFPVIGQKAESTEKRLKFDLPLYGLLGENHGGLMILMGPAEDDQAPQRLLPLFSSRERAIEFLHTWDEDELNQPQYVMEFEPPHIEFLADLLTDAAKHCEAMTIDPGHGEPLFASVMDCSINMRRIFARTRRAFETGIGSIIVKKHTIKESEVMTLYCHDGKYAAMHQPTGNIYFGQTRDEALEALVMSEIEAG